MDTKEYLITNLIQKILDRATTHTLHELYSEYGGYTYSMVRDRANDPWYIQVWPDEGGLVYDGWWRDSEGLSVVMALREAIEGAMVLEDDCDDQ
jgi:hypothetical protein